MTTTSNAIGIINDLIEINNDRVAGFEKSIEDINDENIDLKALFEGYALQSRKNVQELSVLVDSTNESENDESVTGALHRAWIDVKSLFGGSDRAGILSEAERGEDAIKKAYKDALSSGELTSGLLETVSSQAQGINAAHDKIRDLRNIAKA